MHAHMYTHSIEILYDNEYYIAIKNRFIFYMKEKGIKNTFLGKKQEYEIRNMQSTYFSS